MLVSLACIAQLAKMHNLDGYRAKMLILTVVVASLVALTTAQPKHPSISSSFTARGEVEWHTAEETYFGQGWLDRLRLG